MNVQEEINAYNNDELQLYELSPEARRIATTKTEPQRFGWTPSFYARAAGVTMPSKGKPKGYRQSVLAEAEKLCTPDSTPGIKLVPEPTNPYDKYAVKVFVATTRDSFGVYQCFEDVGFLSRGRCPHCGRALTGKTFDNAIDCPDCKGVVRKADGTFHNETVEFNKYILSKLADNKVEIAVDAVVFNAPVGAPKRTLGLSMAFKIAD